MSAFSGSRSLILCYHGVTESPNRQLNSRHLATDLFEKQVAYLTSHFDVVPLSDVFDGPAGKKERRIAITFDDGYTNNLAQALPVLEKFGVPATVFVCSASLVGALDYLWPDALDAFRLVHAGPFVYRDFKFEDLGGYQMVDSATGQGLYDLVKGMSVSEVEAFMSEADEQYDFRSLLDRVGGEHWSLLSEAQLKALSASRLVSIGSHGHSHKNLDSVPDEDLLRELQMSKDIIEDVIQTQVDSVAFPDGAYNERAKEVALSVGYSQMLAVDYRCAGDSEDAHIMSRTMVTSYTSLASQFVQFNLAVARSQLA